MPSRGITKSWRRSSLCWRRSSRRGKVKGGDGQRETAAEGNVIMDAVMDSGRGLSSRLK